MAERPRILLLHGYGQTVETFQKKSESIRKSLGKAYDLIYLEGPHSVINLKGEAGRAWWTFEGDFFTTPTYKGVEESIELVREQLPFDGIVGFSQGAAFAALLCSIFPVKFTFIIGGYPVSDMKYQHYDRITGKTIHIYGENDEIVLPTRSRQLHDLCSGEKQLISHSGRHVVPKLKYLSLI
jgi:predicted esterase